jgi:sulfur relay (sulfurtransferase) complex TusBCD TusD component (DsrE family)
MASYLLIASRDPFESNDVLYYYELSRSLAAAGDEVTLFLVQNGVMAARPSAASESLTALARCGVRVVADDFSLQERGVRALAEGVSIGTVELVVDALESGHKTLWH